MNTSVEQLRGTYASTSTNDYIDQAREFTSLLQINEVESDMNIGISSVDVAGNRVSQITEEADAPGDVPHSSISSMWVKL